MIVFLPARSGFSTGADQTLHCGFSRSNLVPRCANRGQWVLAKTLPRPARAVVGSITGVVLLALDHAGG
jgi:hypothetical protein